MAQILFFSPIFQTLREVKSHVRVIQKGWGREECESKLPDSRLDIFAISGPHQFAPHLEPLPRCPLSFSSLAFPASSSSHGSSSWKLPLGAGQSVWFLLSSYSPLHRALGQPLSQPPYLPVSVSVPRNWSHHRPRSGLRSRCVICRRLITLCLDNCHLGSCLTSLP